MVLQCRGFAYYRASTIYSAQRLLHNIYVHIAAFAVLYGTFDCHIEDTDCSNAAEIPQTILLGTICNDLLPIATANRVCLRKRLLLAQ